MPSTNRRIGLIGLGFGTQVYIPALRSEGWEVAAICSRSRDKVAKAADAEGIRDTHTEPMELIARDDLHAVAIATPPRAHHELHQGASRRRLHRPVPALHDRALPGTSPSPNFTDGLRCQEVLDAVRASSRSGRTVKLR